METENGIKWLEEQVSAIADELDIRLDRPPEWQTSDSLNFKMAVEVAGRREILKLWRPHIDDCQGGNNQPTRKVQTKLQAQLREFMETLGHPKGVSVSAGQHFVARLCVALTPLVPAATDG